MSGRDQTHAIRWAVYGGSFNPVHLGHLAVCRAVAARPDVERLLVVPARRSPFKPEDTILPDGLRWAMLSAALDGLDKVSLSALEYEAPPPSFTIHTLERLAALHPGPPPWLVVGADVLPGFAGWKEAARLLELASLLVVDRSGPGREPPNQWAAGVARLLPPPWPRRLAPRPPDRLVCQKTGRLVVERMAVATPDISSTAIRQGRLLEQVPAAARPLLASHWGMA